VKEKIAQYYYAYIGYFSFIYIFMFIVDKSGIFKPLTKKLYEEAYDEKVYLDWKPTNGDLKLCSFSYTEEYLSKEGDEDIINERKESNVDEVSDGKIVEKSKPSVEIPESVLYKLYKMFAPFKIDDSAPEFSYAFYEYIENAPAYIGCKPILYPIGYRLCHLYSLNYMVGQIEDFYVTLFNNHTFLSCILCAKKSAFSRNKRRIAFTVQHSFTFLSSSFNFALVTIGMSPIVAILINTLVISRIGPALNAIVYNIMVCSCLEHRKIVDKFPMVIACLKDSGLVIAFCLMILGLVSLLVATLFSTGQNHSGIVMQYFLTVHVYGFIVEYLRKHFHKFTLCSLRLFSILSNLVNSYIHTYIHTYLKSFGGKTFPDFTAVLQFCLVL
jgi:hypothetical protein